MPRPKNIRTSSKEATLVKDIREVRSILRNINWNFYPRISSRYPGIRPFDCRKFHWFPATFIPEIPFTLIEILTLPGAVIYDPFGGIGTTYFQALLLSRSPLTAEICRVAIEYMKGLFTLFNPTIDLDALKYNIEKIIKKFDTSKNYVSTLPKNVLGERLRPWFSEKTFNQLSFLCSEEHHCIDLLTKACLRITISAILKTISSQERGWGCIADNVLPKKVQIKDKSVLNVVKIHTNKLFKSVAEALGHVMPDYSELYAKISTEQTIFHEDARNCKEIPDRCVDLVITSPPYPNMADYVTSQRLSYYLLGHDLMGQYSSKDLDLEIGARRKRTRIDSLSQYLQDMTRSNEVISSKIKKGGYACFVMPVFNTDNENNYKRRNIVQKVLADLENHNLVREDELERLVPAKRRQHNQKWATLEREKIYLFRKE